MKTTLTENDKQLVKSFNTPLFIVDTKSITIKYNFLKNKIRNSKILYSYKTNPHKIVAETIKEINGDIVVSSKSELFELINKGISVKAIYFHSIASSSEELNEIINTGIRNITINRLSDYEKIKRITRVLNCQIDLGIRLDTNNILNQERTITKFGMSVDDLIFICKDISTEKQLRLKSIGFHYGTNLLDLSLYLRLLNSIVSLAKSLNIKSINIGGGLPSDTILDEKNSKIEDYIRIINKNVNTELTILLEPGRYIVEDSCYCLSKIISVESDYAICDISTNILPALKNSNYRVHLNAGNKTLRLYGRLCYEGDIIFNHLIDISISEGDIIKILNTGAYTIGMQSIMGYPNIQVVKL